MLSGRFNADNYPDLAARLALLAWARRNSSSTHRHAHARVDLTASHKGELAGNRLNTFVALNLSKTEVTKVKTPASLTGFEDVLLSERERLFIEQGGPRAKATLGFDYITGKLESDLRIIYFGPQTLGTFSGTAEGVPNARYKAKTSADLSFTYSISKNTKLTFAATTSSTSSPPRKMRTRRITASNTTACNSAERRSYSDGCG